GSRHTAPSRSDRRLQRRCTSTSPACAREAEPPTTLRRQSRSSARDASSPRSRYGRQRAEQPFDLASGISESTIGLFHFRTIARVSRGIEGPSGANETLERASRRETSIRRQQRRLHVERQREILGLEGRHPHFAEGALLHQV